MAFDLPVFRLVSCLLDQPLEWFSLDIHLPDLGIDIRKCLGVLRNAVFLLQVFELRLTVGLVVAVIVANNGLSVSVDMSRHPLSVNTVFELCGEVPWGLDEVVSSSLRISSSRSVVDTCTNSHVVAVPFLSNLKDGIPDEDLVLAVHLAEPVPLDLELVWLADTSSPGATTLSCWCRLTWSV